MSARLSITLVVYCVETTELIIKQIVMDCSLGTLVYSHQHGTDVLRGSPSSGRQIGQGVEKLRFHTNMRLYDVKMRGERQML